MSDAQKAGNNLAKGLHLAGPARGFPRDSAGWFEPWRDGKG
jgi:hypothetical protein